MFFISLGEIDLTCLHICDEIKITFILIAGVFENRLEKNMKIQSDISVLYALGKHKQNVTYKDLEVDSFPESSGSLAPPFCKAFEICSSVIDGFSS